MAIEIFARVLYYEGMRKYYLRTKVFVVCMYDDNMLK